MKMIVVPNKYKTQEISDKSFKREFYELKYVYDKCERAVNANLEILEGVAHRFKSKEICEKVIENKLYFFQYVTNRYKTK